MKSYASYFEHVQAEDGENPPLAGETVPFSPNEIPIAEAAPAFSLVIIIFLLALLGAPITFPLTPPRAPISACVPT